MRATARLLLLSAALVLAAVAPARAELDVASYAELTVARLELIEAAWRETDAPPSEEELDRLYAEFDTDREAYVCFAGEMKDEIERHLDENPEIREAIESLSAAIRRRIAEREE